MNLNNNVTELLALEGLADATNDMSIAIVVLFSTIVITSSALVGVTPGLVMSAPGTSAKTSIFQLFDY